MPTLETNLCATLPSMSDQLNGRKAVHDSTDQLAWLDAKAARNGMTLAVDWVDGDWRAGFLETNELGEAEFVLHASGPDGRTAVGRLAELVADLG